MSERKVRRCLECLKSTGEITDIANNHFRVITVVNYDEYQDVLPLSKKQGKRQGKRKGKGQDKEQGNKQGKRYPIEESKKCVCLTDTHTQENEAAAPGALGERERADKVTYVDVRRYQIDNRIGGGEEASEFYSGFEKSGTRIPDDWQKIYRAFIRASDDERERFMTKLLGGGFRDKWGADDE